LISELEVEDFKGLIQEKRQIKEKFRLTVEELDTDLYRLHIQKSVAWGPVRGYAFLDTSQKGIWIVYSNEGSYFLRRVLERLFKLLYPRLSRIHLNYLQIFGLLDIIRKAYRGQATLTYFTVKRKPKTAKVPFWERGTIQLWEREAEKELRKQLEEYRVKVDQVNFQVRDSKSKAVLLRGRILRRGICSLQFGSFSDFQKNVVLNMIGLGMRWREFYEHRERIVVDGRVYLRPFSISYTFDFDKTQIRDLAEEISKTYSSSIVHAGNPYFVANVCDYRDGSSFGVTVLGNLVTITPIIKATPQATWKLVDRIQEVLGDGEVLSVAV